ncbi:hypothetical protein AB2L28_04295 [Kineococcus sp. TBRC 1896]|uniref:Uncharacterized protein n=1 Tax=Kineococcus mangrovi TaxID=1660183 RepID=A0ABV4HYF9_9ACTN
MTADVGRPGPVHVSMVVVQRPQTISFDPRSARQGLGTALRRHLHDRDLVLSGPALESVDPVPDTGAVRYLLTALAVPRG